MLKILRLIIFLSCISISCNFHSKNETKINENYSDINLDFIEGITSKIDTLTYRVNIELSLDSNEVLIWKLNGENILRSNLLSELEKIQLNYPKLRQNHISIDLGIHKNVRINEFIELRDTLRIGNYLRGSYLNSNNQRLNVRFPISQNMRPSKLIPTSPPPPPGIQELMCLCCEKEGEFSSSILDYQTYTFDNYFNCMKSSNLSESYTYVHTEKNIYYWEGNEFDLSTIEDSLQTKYENYYRPNRFITILKIDPFSKFESYFNLYSVCRKIYVEKWNEESLMKFGSLYKDLSKKDKKEIRNKYPLVIAEYFD